MCGIAGAMMPDDLDLAAAKLEQAASLGGAPCVKPAAELDITGIADQRAIWVQRIDARVQRSGRRACMLVAARALTQRAIDLLRGGNEEMFCRAWADLRCALIAEGVRKKRAGDAAGVREEDQTVARPGRAAGRIRAMLVPDTCKGE